MRGLLLTIKAACSPAMLNDLVGEFRMTLFFLQASLMEANGVNVYPGMTSSQWISSEMTFTPFLMQILFIRSSSSFFHTLPDGLWGLQSKNTIVFSSSHFLSKSSKSMA